METIAKVVDAAITSAPSPSTYDKKWQTAYLSAVIATIERLTDPMGTPSAPGPAPFPPPKAVSAKSSTLALQAGKTDLPWNTVAKGKGKALNPETPSAPSPSPTSPPLTYVKVVG